MAGNGGEMEVVVVGMDVGWSMYLNTKSSRPRLDAQNANAPQSTELTSMTLIEEVHPG